MNPSPNPFADEPLPAGVVRLQSAVNPLDPYAAPPSADEYRPPSDPGVGLWREGKYLVMHLNSGFPLRCLATNEPTDIRRTQTISWCYPIDWNTRSLKVEYFISPTELARRKRVRRIGLLVAGVVFLAAVALWQIPAGATFLQFERWGPLAYIGLAVAFFGGAVKAWQPGVQLQFVRARKSYLWFSGPGAAFLDSLPIWPGLK